LLHENRVILTRVQRFAQNVMVFKYLAALVLVITPVAGAQSSGVLIGFSTFDGKRSEGEAPKPPTFHTLWVTHTDGRDQAMKAAGFPKPLVH